VTKVICKPANGDGGAAPTGTPLDKLARKAFDLVKDEGLTPAALTALASEVRAEFGEYLAGERRTVDRACRIGKVLDKVWDKLKEEKRLTSWLKAAGLPRRTALDFRKIYQERGKWATVAHTGVRGVLEILRGLEKNTGHARPVPPPPAGQFALILADPPWTYEFSETNSRRIEVHYPTLSLDEIKALPVPAAPDSVLFLWSPAPTRARSSGGGCGSGAIRLRTSSAKGCGGRGRANEQQSSKGSGAFDIRLTCARVSPNIKTFATSATLLPGSG
jgi:hypothetical protein